MTTWTSRERQLVLDEMQRRYDTWHTHVLPASGTDGLFLVGFARSLIFNSQHVLPEDRRLEDSQQLTPKVIREFNVDISRYAKSVAEHNRRTNDLLNRVDTKTLIEALAIRLDQSLREDAYRLLEDKIFERLAQRVDDKIRTLEAELNKPEKPKSTHDEPPSDKTTNTTETVVIIGLTSTQQSTLIGKLTRDIKLLFLGTNDIAHSGQCKDRYVVCSRWASGPMVEACKKKARYFFRLDGGVTEIVTHLNESLLC